MSVTHSGVAGSNRLDLAAYLKRIGYAGALQPTYDVFEALHLGQATHIPFENLDILLNRPIRLDLESLQAKLVTGGRGGYCFEQNLLLSAVLREVGFTVTQLAARVRYGTQRLLPRTHMLLLVHIGGAAWLADVGFGAQGLLLPVPFRAGEATRQFAWTYRVIDEAGQCVLQSRRDDSWIDLYAFTLEPQQYVDYELANYFVSTHPTSRFVQALTVQRTMPEARHMLIDREYIVERAESATRRTVTDDDELLDLLSQTFDLRFPPGTRFRVRGA